METNVNRAIVMIAELKQQKLRLVKENESLRRQIEELRTQSGELKKALASGKGAQKRSPKADEFRMVKDRLEKLVGKLAALEDSWT